MRGSSSPSAEPTSVPSSSPSEAPSLRPTRIDSKSCSSAVYADVVIVGAGAAGIAAAARLHAIDPNLDIKILESTDRIGGRVRSTQFGGYTVEEGANWMWPDTTNPVWNEANAMGLDFVENDWYDWSLYNMKTGAAVKESKVSEVLESLDNAWDGAVQDMEAYWGDNPPPDNGIVKVFADNGFKVGKGDTLSDNLEYAMEWIYIDWSMAKADVSALSFPYANANQLVLDQRGFESLIQTYHDNHVRAGSLVTNMRVTEIEYDIDLLHDGKDYKARIVAETSSGCVDYFALRTILTVSTGVINNDLVSFSPPLAYPHETHSPFEMAQSVKLFYQFDTAFWDSTEYLVAVQDLANRGRCQQWLNLNHDSFHKNSKILVCFLMTEAFEEVADASGTLTSDILDALLDPLRTIYQNKFVDPIDMQYVALNKDIDFGYGALAYWKIGSSLQDYANFFGGFPTLTAYCEHNGCNQNGEWILHVSGACACLDQWESVQGAWGSGERSAKFVLDSLGYRGIDTSDPFCNG